MSTKLSSMNQSTLHLENLDNEQAVTVNDALNFFSIKVNQSLYTYVLHSPYISSIVGTCSGRF